MSKKKKRGPPEQQLPSAAMVPPTRADDEVEGEAPAPAPPSPPPAAPPPAEPGDDEDAPGPALSKGHARALGNALARVSLLARGIRAITRLFGSKQGTDEDAPDAWDRALDWFALHGAPIALLALTLFLGIGVYGRLFYGEIAGDDLTFHFAESGRIADCIRAGDWDWWNPSANGGYASAYYYQVIPQLSSAVPTAIFGHHLFWFQLSNWLPLVLAPAAAYRGMRMMGASTWEALAAAFCVAFMNGESRWGSGAAGSFHVGLYTQTWALSAFPLALGYGARWIDKGEKLAPAIAWGAFVTMCHPFAAISLGFALVLAAVAKPFLSLTDQLFILIGEAIQPQTPKKRPRDPADRFVYDLATRWKTLPGWKRLEGWSFLRVAILGPLMLLCVMPIWLPLLADYSGFGGFPHRVADEIGPGFTDLAKWHFGGKVLDFMDPNLHKTRMPVLTYMLVPVVLFARGPYMRWLLVPATFYVLCLGIGPHLGTTQDDLLPMVRFLGALQTVLALAIGAGFVAMCRFIWRLFDKSALAYGVQTVILAGAIALGLIVAIPGSYALGSLVRVMPEFEGQHRDELMQIAHYLETAPPGRKQVGQGAENHWWNLLTFIYGRTNSLLQMGGGGLQASPNYDYLWSQRDHTKNAWLYDAPYLVFARQNADKMPGGETLLVPKQKKVFFDDPNVFWPKMHVGEVDGNFELRRLPSPGLVSPVQVIGVMPPGPRKGEPGHDAALLWLRGDGPVVDQVLAYDGYGPAGDVPHGRTIKSWHQMSGGSDPDIVAEVEVDQPTTFLVRESWHPRWHAYIDGEEVPVRRMTPDFPAVDVPAGTHELSLRFERPWWMWLAWFVWPGVSLLAWFGVKKLNARNRPSESQVPAARVVKKK